MHELFINKPIYFYPDRIAGINFNEIEIWPMQFDTPAHSLDNASECEADEADFYSVFVLISAQGRDTIADCATKELAESIKDRLQAIF